MPTPEKRDDGRAAGVVAEEQTRVKGKRKRKQAGEPASWAEELGLVAAGNMLIKARGILLLPIIAGAMGAASYGVWVQAQAFAHLMSTFGSLNLRTAAVRLLAGAEREDARVSFWSMFSFGALISAVAGVLTFMFAPWAGRMLTHEPDVGRLFQLVALSAPLLAMNEFQIAALRGLGKIRTYNVLHVLRSAGDSLVIIVALLIRKDLATAMMALLLWRVVLSLALLRNSLQLLPFIRPRWQEARAALAYSIPASPAAVSNMLLDKSDRFVIGYFMGAAAVGVYNAAYSFSMLLFQIVQPLRVTMVPRLGAMWDRGQQQQATDTIALVWRYFMLLGLATVLGMAVLGEHVLRLLTNREIAAAAGPLIGWIALGVLAFGATTIVNQVFFARKQTHFMPLIYGSGALANIGMNILLVPRIGLAGAVVSTIVAYLLSFVVSARLAKREGDLRLPYALVARAALAAVLMAGVALLIAADSWPRLVLATIFGALSYALGLWWLGALEPRERALLRSKLPWLRPKGAV